ncbi:MAG: triose-phosphate isomerase [Acidobacteriota bacterium]|nr:MAG: triose-phosphate isomerase [Acidobacteriota bacterium]
MTRRPLIVANWKMHHTRTAAEDWCSKWHELREDEPWPERIEIGVAPAFTALKTLRARGRSLTLALVGQNCHQEPFGPFTGEVSAGMLEDAGCAMVIVGHIERRQHYGETDRLIAQKVKAVREAGMVPIVCVGESENQRESGRTEPIIESQLRHALSLVSLARGAEIVVAYEPVWAIGTGRVAQPEQAEAAQAFLRGILASITNRDVAGDARILYGGSVNPDNASVLAEQPHVDGFLVGGASLDAGTFHRIVKAFAPLVGD